MEPPTLTYSPFRAKGSGRAIPIVTIGDGARGIMIIANQHGDEYVVSNSAVEIVRALTRNSAWARSVRDELTVTIMPRVNIDGFDANPGEPLAGERRSERLPAPALPRLLHARPRVRHQPLPLVPGQRPARRSEHRAGRDRTGRQPRPRGARGRAAYDAAGGPQVVEVAMDLHHQGTPLDANGDMVTGSTLWPNATSTADPLGIRPQFDGGDLPLEAGRRDARRGGPPVRVRELLPLPGNDAAGDLAQRVRAARIGLRPGRAPRVGQKANGYIAKTGFVAAASVVEALADGSL